MAFRFSGSGKESPRTTRDTDKVGMRTPLRSNCIQEKTQIKFEPSTRGNKKLYTQESSMMPIVRRISPMANICTLCAWQASLPIYEWQIRTPSRGSFLVNGGFKLNASRAVTSTDAVCAGEFVRPRVTRKRKKHLK